MKDFHVEQIENGWLVKVWYPSESKEESWNESSKETYFKELDEALDFVKSLK